MSVISFCDYRPRISDAPVTKAAATKRDRRLQLTQARVSSLKRR
jgi:hypothetical protein